MGKTFFRQEQEEESFFENEEAVLKKTVRNKEQSYKYN